MALGLALGEKQIPKLLKTQRSQNRECQRLRSVRAHASRAISWKSFLFNLSFDNKRVREIFGGARMYGNVAPHA